MKDLRKLGFEKSLKKAFYVDPVKLFAAKIINTIGR
jgi:hypothetical protein